MPLEIPWEVLGSEDSGLIGGWPGAPGEMRVPAVELVGDELQFRFAKGWSGDHYLIPPPDLLDRFLAMRTTRQIEMFATRFGPLALFETAGSPDPKQLAESLWQGGVFTPGVHRERVEWWRHLQRQFRAVLALVSAFHLHEDPSDAMFLELDASGVYCFREALPSEVRSAGGKERRELAVTAARIYTGGLVAQCGVRPGLRLDHRRDPVGVDLVFQDEWFGRGALCLPGALAVQLLSPIAGARFALCSACGQPFVPQRRQAGVGRRRYCRLCVRQGAAVRDAKVDYRARLRELGVRRMRDVKSGDVTQRRKSVASKQSSKK